MGRGDRHTCHRRGIRAGCERLALGHIHLHQTERCGHIYGVGIKGHIGYRPGVAHRGGLGYIRDIDHLLGLGSAIEYINVSIFVGQQHTVGCAVVEYIGNIGSRRQIIVGSVAPALVALLIVAEERSAGKIKYVGRGLDGARHRGGENGMYIPGTGRCRSRQRYRSKQDTSGERSHQID